MKLMADLNATRARAEEAYAKLLQEKPAWAEDTIQGSGEDFEDAGARERAVMAVMQVETLEEVGLGPAVRFYYCVACSIHQSVRPVDWLAGLVGSCSRQRCV